MNAPEWLDRAEKASRADAWRFLPQTVAALRAVLGGHYESDKERYPAWAGCCAHDRYRWPCPTVRAVTEALT